MSTEYAPIVLFVYNRPLHTGRTLDALSRNLLAEHSHLFIFCDGPKQNATGADLAKILEVRRVVRSKKWCGEVTIIENDTNSGLAKSVIAGVTEIVNKFGKVIVLEDDLLTSKYFLGFMNTALDKYLDEKEVMQISGHQFEAPGLEHQSGSFFLPFTTSWGWATWQRAWRQFDPVANGYKLLQTDATLRKKFDLNGTCQYSSMLESQMKGNYIDSWAIRWYWSVFRKNGIVLFPDKTLIRNVGFGPEATHTFIAELKEEELDQEYQILNYPDVISEDTEKMKELINFFARKEGSNTSNGLLDKLVSLFKRT